MAGGIFISYRREDSAAYARLIYDRVAARVKRSRVFIDVHDIAPGRDFVKALSDQVGACDILVAIVGKRWSDARDANGGRRLDDPRDFVRIEIEAALQRDIRVIPVLVDGAAMPNAADLPEGLRSFCNRQALEISHSRFDADATALTKCLDEAEELRASPLAKGRSFGWLAAAAVILIGGAAGVAWVWSHPGSEVAVAPKPVASSASSPVEASAVPKTLATPTASPLSETVTPVARKAAAPPTLDATVTAPSPSPTPSIVAASPSTEVVSPSLSPSATPIADKAVPSPTLDAVAANPSPTPSIAVASPSAHVDPPSAKTDSVPIAPSSDTPIVAPSTPSSTVSGSDASQAANRDGATPTPAASPSPRQASAAEAKRVVTTAPSPSDTASAAATPAPSPTPIVRVATPTPTPSPSPVQTSVAEAKAAASPSDGGVKSITPEPAPSQTIASTSDKDGKDDGLGKAIDTAVAKAAATAESQLQRAGCYDGVLRNFEAPEVKSAIANYAKQAGLSGPPAVGPWNELFASLATVNGRVCPLICPAGSFIASDRCIRRPIAILHPVAPRPPAIVHTEAARARPHAAHHASGSNCFDFDGQRICQ